jgi:hypothetical protein
MDNSNYKQTFGCDVHSFECTRCGEEWHFARGATDTDIRRALEAHSCSESVKLAA